MNRIATTIAIGMLIMIRDVFLRREVIPAEEAPKAYPICPFKVSDVGKQAVFAAIYNLNYLG